MCGVARPHSQEGHHAFRLRRRGRAVRRQLHHRARPGRRRPAEDEVQRGQGGRPRRLLPLLVHQRHRQVNVVFGGSNNIWVVFEDYVVVIDANFPKEAGDVIAAVKKTTDKPIRYVLDTHHHGDHAYGNAVFAKAGASIVAQANCARLLRINGPKEFAEAGKGPTGRKDVADSKLKVPNVVFDDKLVLDDGKQRVEFLFLGHAHTAGDAFAYLPKHKILCTGDACVNGAFNFMGHSDSASWIRVLERMQQLDVKIVCPGHGPLAGKDLLEKQKRYFVELRQQVQAGHRRRQDRRGHSQEHRHALVQGVDRRAADRRTTSSTSTTS